MKTISSAHIDNSQRNVGIDVGKSTLDVMILETDTYFQEPNSPEGIKRLVSRMGRFKLTRIIVEATGGYERYLVEACAEKTLPIIVVQPMQVRQFARAQSLLAKTEKLDARLIALFGAIIKPEPRPIQSKKIRYIRDLLSRKRQLNETRTQELNRLHKAPKVLAPSHTRLLKLLDKEIA